ncbi:Hypothetical_protein [Hexamita inflata]|uniref:Hypothetical_protein n=1 Tax=Hexamita inflata TaxID=28002 RepID=A0ABP1I2H5_9EUKA
MTKTSRNSKQLVLEPLIFQPNNFRARASNMIQNNPSTQRSVQKISNSSSLERPKFVICPQSQKVILTFKIELLNEQMSELHKEINQLESQLQQSFESLNCLCDAAESILHNNCVQFQ